MCQCQLSSSTLPSEAATPPCAATVCERVGKTLESTATLRSARASWSAARSPEPPPPTITASKDLTASATQPPHYLHRPHGVIRKRDDRNDVEREPPAGVLDVIHIDVAHPDPGVHVQAEQEQHRGVACKRQIPQCLPVPVVELGQACQHRQEHERVHAHDDRGDALSQPVAQPVVGAYDLALHHRSE